MANSPIPRKVRESVYRRDGYLCQYCGIDTLTTETGPTADHFVSQRGGGSHEAHNLMTACFSCNSRKGGRSIEWLRSHLAVKQSIYAGIIDKQAYDALRGLGVVLEDLPAVRFFYEGEA